MLDEHYSELGYGQIFLSRQFVGAPYDIFGLDKINID